MDAHKLETTLLNAGQPAYRASQAKKAVFGDLVGDWSEATTLPKALRERLVEEVPISSVEPLSTVRSSRGDTIKSAFRLADGNVVEAVLMRHKGGRNTVCISSQAGCPMACSFCATGTLGLKRNLTAEEITDQALHFSRVLAPSGERVTNAVFMGMGEPMHNYDAVLAATRTLNAPDAFGIGARHISVSTCGIVAGILRLAEEPLQVNLAVSLHAPTDDLRSRLMPVNRAQPLDRLMDAVRTYVERTNRKVFFEYLLIDGLNDALDVADDLADLLNHPLYHVNLIKYHTTGAYESSPKDRREAFMKRLEERGVSVTHRITFGEDIDAACGQLANKHAK